MTDLPFLTDGAAPANPGAPAPRKCYRHQWMTYVDDHDMAAHGPLDACVATCRATVSCERCGARRNQAVTDRNRRSRKRGNRTSGDLATYLGGEDVERKGWPWDVQGRGYRIQSKRLADRPSAAALVRLIEAIPYRADDLRAVYFVPARARLTSGLVIVGLREWVDQHGWAVTQDTRPFYAFGELLLEMPLPTFRDLHIGRTDQ